MCSRTQLATRYATSTEPCQPELIPVRIGRHAEFPYHLGMNQEANRWGSSSNHGASRRFVQTHWPRRPVIFDMSPQRQRSTEPFKVVTRNQSCHCSLQTDKNQAATKISKISFVWVAPSSEFTKRSSAVCHCLTPIYIGKTVSRKGRSQNPHHLGTKRLLPEVFQDLSRAMFKCQNLLTKKPEGQGRKR